MRTELTYTATIYVGTRQRTTGELLPLDMAREWLQRHVNKQPLCVTLTPTEYIYTLGSEPGFAIGLINYPRFPSTPEYLRERALFIAEAMLGLYKQGKVTVVFPGQTVTIGPDLAEPSGRGLGRDPETCNQEGTAQPKSGTRAKVQK